MEDRDEEARLLERERRTAATHFLTQRFGFLCDEFGYAPPFEIPAQEDTYIIAFRNDAAGRQVEVSGRLSGDRFHCEIRRFVNGEPGGYDTDSISHADLERVREPSPAREAVYRSFEEDVNHYGALLRRHPDLLRGDAWIDQRDIKAVFARDILEKFGFPPDPDPPGWLDEARPLANVLVDRHGFALVLDSDTLSPHEGELWSRLVYRRGDTTVEIVLDDFRLDEWFVRLNGTTIHHFTPWSTSELLSALAAIERLL